MEKGFLNFTLNTEKLGISNPGKNPYYEKWKRGRPSKAAKEKRAKARKWMIENPVKIEFKPRFTNER